MKASSISQYYYQRLLRNFSPSNAVHLVDTYTFLFIPLKNILSQIFYQKGGLFKKAFPSTHGGQFSVSSFQTSSCFEIRKSMGIQVAPAGSQCFLIACLQALAWP